MRMIQIRCEQSVMESQQEAREKEVENEVLKEMIKGVQIQLKTKDNEVIRLNKKVL